jgi:hypothetical protein
VSVTIKAIVDVVAKPLAYIFNLSFHSGVYPTDFKVARVVPVFKGGDHSVLNNYRPISLLISVSKILEKLMCNRMFSFINKFSLLSACQYGFRQHRSTTDAVADLINYVTCSIDNQCEVGALYVDVAKAFDSIDHAIVLQKLHSYGFRGMANVWLRSYFANRMQYVELNGVKSNLRKLRTGIPEGSILGPLIFLLYINDLPLVCPDAHFVLYADDTTCLTHPSKLQLICNAVYDWFTRNRLAVNIGKTKVMFFSLCNVNFPVITMAGRIVECVKVFKFLGCLIDSKLTWQANVRSVSCKVVQGIALLKCFSCIAPCYVRRMIYYAFIYPHITYCLAVWGSAAKVYTNKVLVLQKRAIRLVFSVGKCEHVLPLAHLGSFLLLTELYLKSLYMYMFHVLKYYPHVLKANNFVQRSADDKLRSTRSGNDYFIPFARTSLRRNSVLFQMVLQWNNLPLNLKNLLFSISLFKKQVFAYLLERYSE